MHTETLTNCHTRAAQTAAYRAVQHAFHESAMFHPITCNFAGRDTRLRSVGNDEREQTLNQLLTELDGFDTSPDKIVICIAATNRPDVLDPALLRPGRFDRRVAVERPDRIGRMQILKTHIEKQGLPLAEDVTTDGIAAGTTGSMKQPCWQADQTKASALCSWNCHSLLSTDFADDEVAKLSHAVAK